MTSAAAASLLLGLLVAAPAMAQEETNPEAKRPMPGLNRWQEDWSVLADPALRTEPLDGLKYIPLSSDPDTYLSLGAGLRERFETNDAPGLHVTPGQADSYLISRLETHADLHAGPVQVFVQLQSDFAPFKRNRSAVDANSLDLEQGFIALVEPVGPGTLKLRIGRQQFAFDLQRFVAVRDGPNVRQSFDAVWGDYEIGKWRLIGYYARPAANRDDHPFDDASSTHNLFYGARIERQVLGGQELSAYWSRYTNDSARFLFASGAERRDVWDIRFAGKPTLKSALDWDAELMAQTGHVADQTIRAWGMGAKIGYSFRKAALKPHLGMQVDAASGDGHPGDGKIGTFNPLFPNGAYLNLAGYTGYTNFLHVKPSLTVNPSSRLAVMGAVAAEWRMTTQDAVYTQPNVPVPNTAGRGSRWTGTYEQLRLDWKASTSLTGAIEAVHFIAGDTIRAAGGSDSNYLGVELKFAW